MTDEDKRLVEAVKAKFAVTAAGLKRLRSRAAQARLMRDFWLDLPPAELAAWIRAVMQLGFRRWQLGMTPAERHEYSARLSAAGRADGTRSERAARRQMARSPEERSRLAHAGARARWAMATPEQRNSGARPCCRRPGGAARAAQRPGGSELGDEASETR
jgi:hypothetical protein